MPAMEAAQMSRVSSITAMPFFLPLRIFSFIVFTSLCDINMISQRIFEVNSFGAKSFGRRKCFRRALKKKNEIKWFLSKLRRRGDFEGICAELSWFDKNKSIDLEENFLQDNLPEINRNEYNILLSHTPFYFDEYEKWGADLILAGHVHGGIIRIPFVGGLLSPNRQFFPKYDLGKYNKNNSTMIVTKGLGGSKVLVRINCKPEIVKIILKSKHY